MKFLLALIALAAAAVAAPSPQDSRPPPPPPPPYMCKPATYACTKDPKTGQDGWEVCNTSGMWVFAGDCPPYTKCVFNQANGSPYCLPK